MRGHFALRSRFCVFYSKEASAFLAETLSRKKIFWLHVRLHVSIVIDNEWILGISSNQIRKIYTCGNG